MSTDSSTSSAYKRAKLSDDTSTKVIGTHSGTFQADEAMGVWMLRQIPTYRNAKVIRSRDTDVLESSTDIVLDVGGIYNHDLLKYDHHQRGYDERFTPRKNKNNNGVEEQRCTKLSASGLIYRHYGKQVLQAYYPELTDPYLDLAYHKIYNSLLEALDAIDTGVEPAKTMLYKDSTGLSSRVGRLNPRWNEVDATTGMVPDPDERFQLAVELCGQDFCSVMTSIVESDLPARAHVEHAFQQRYTTDPSGEIIVLESGGLPWRNHLYDLEHEFKSQDENANMPLIKFVLYTDQSNMWRIQAVTVEGQAFTNRLSLPEEWRGLRDAELEAVSQIKGARFVHAAGFIGGADDYEGVLQMARATLALESKA